MPSWAFNTYRFDGTAEDIAFIRDSIYDGAFDFNKIIPTPQELIDSSPSVEVVSTQAEADKINDEWQNVSIPGVGSIRAITYEERARRLNAYGAADWYDFQCIHWGTKWEGSNAEILDSGDTHMVVSFRTAWGEPTGIFQHLSNRGIVISGGTLYEETDEVSTMGYFDKYFDIISEDHEETYEYNGETHTDTWTDKKIVLK